MKLCDNCNAPLTRDWKKCGMCGLMNPAPRTRVGTEDQDSLVRRALEESEIDGTGYCFISDAWQTYLELSSK